jgi:hypothetical protein
MNERNEEKLTKTIETINMFLKRLSTALVTITCLGLAALGAAPNTLTTATNIEKEKSLLAPLEVTVNLIPTSPRCHNESDGKIEVKISGTNTPPYTYRIQKDTGTPSPAQLMPTADFFITGLLPGNYTIYVTDNSSPASLSGYNSVEVKNPAELLLSLNTTSLIYPKCVGDLATINFSAVGGSVPYNYTLYRDGAVYLNNISGNFSGLPDGTYTAIATDAVGCTKNYNGSVSINKIEPINISYSIVNEINCDNGYASVKITSLPSDPFTIVVRNTTNNRNYDNHNAEFVYSNLDAGNYTVTVTRNSCTANRDVENFTIAAFNDVVVSPNPVSPVTLNCGGVNDLTNVQVAITGGKPSRQVHVVFDNNDGISTNDQEITKDYGSTFVFDNIPAGNYRIRWNDVENPSCSGTQSYVISPPPSPLIWMNNPVGIQPLCNGDANGVIQINVSGGTSPYSYYVDGALTIPPIKRAAGTYNVYVKDGNNCLTEEKAVTISQPDPLVVTHNVADDIAVTCPGGNNGEIHMEVAGGSGGYTYDLTHTSTSGSPNRTAISTDSIIGIIALIGGTYDVQVKDKNSCKANDITGINIDEPAAIQIANADFILDTIQCNGEKATLMVKATGGSDPNLSYKLYSGTTLIDSKISSGVVTFNNLIPASYTLNVWSDLNCPDFLTKSFTVVDRRKLVVINAIDSITLKCPGDVPSVTLSVSGEAPFWYSIDGSTVQNVPITGNSVVISSGLTKSTAGSLNRIIVKDKYNCLNDVFVKIFEPSPIITSIPTTLDVKCNSKRNGSISLTVSGGTPGYTLSLIDAVTSTTVKTYPATSNVEVTIPALYAGTYNLQIKDKNNCLAPTPPTGIIINQPDSLVIEKPVYTELKCNGDATDAYFNVTGGWAGVDKTVKITGSGKNMTIPSGTNYSLKAGTYTLTASNKDGCYAAPMQFTIDQPEKLILNTPVVDNVSCNGANDAKITFSVTGGTPDYMYGLHGAGSASIPFTGTSCTINSDLVASTYNLVVQDANSCQSTVNTVIITEPTKVDFTYTTDSVTCFGLSDGKITIAGTGGNDNSYIAYLNGVKSTFPVISGLAVGTYNVNITDSKKCSSVTKIISIGQPDVIVINSAIISDSLSCNNDQDASITIDAVGGQPYNLQYKITGRDYQPSNKFINLPSGEYEIWVKNSHGNCETKYKDKLMIVNPDELVVTNVVPIDVSCYNKHDGSVKINAKGGTGTKNYYLIDAPVSIQPNPNSTGQFDSLGNLNSTSTIYNYKVVDSKGCTKTGSFPVLNPPELKIKELDHQDVTCNNLGNGWIEVEVTGGTGDYSFQKNVAEAVTGDVEKINNSSFKIIKYGGGNFTPVVIDKKGCSSTVTPLVTIKDPPILKIDSVSWGTIKCNGDRDNVTTIHAKGGTPGYYYSLDNGENYKTLNDSVFVGEPAGNYYPRVKDKNDCLTPKSELHELTEPSALWVGYKFKPIKCFNDKYGDLELKIVGGTKQYLLSYKEGADASYPINPLPIAYLPTDTTTFLLSSDGKVDLKPEIHYFFYLQDANKCPVKNIDKVRDVTDYFADTTLNIPPELILESLTPHRVKCGGNDETGRIEFTASGGTAPDKYKDYTLKAILDGHPNPVNYSQGINSVENLRAGLYQVTLTDKNGCYAKTKTSSTLYTDTTSIEADNVAIELNISKIDSITCDRTHDGAIEISIKNFLEEGIFWEAQIWENDTSRTTRNATVTENDYIEADSFNAEGTAGHMLFSAYSQRILEDIGIGRYVITVTDKQSECYASIDTILYSVNGDSCPPLNYYNAFTQYDGGSKYNEWRIGGSKNLVYNLKIYTGYGELVYDSNDKNGEIKVSAADKNGIKWDGLDNKNRPVPAGTYIYLLHTGLAPKDTSINGNITILRNNGR